MAVTNSSGTGTFGSDTIGSAGTKRNGGEGQDEQHGLLNRVRDSATAQLSSQKDRAVDGLGSAARAVRQSTQQLRDQDHETVASYVEQAADQIERLTQRLREKDLGDLLDDAQRLARRQPSLFVGTAFAIGLLGARFLKSSGDDDDEYDDDYRRRYAPSRGFAGTRQAEDWRRGSMGSAGARPGVGGSTPATGLGTPGLSTPGSSLSDPGHSSSSTGATTDLTQTPGGASSGQPSSGSGSAGTSTTSSQSTSRGRKGSPGSSGSDTERF